MAPLLCALAFAAPGQLAHATEGCNLSDGLPAETKAFVKEASACLSGQTGYTFDTATEAELQRLTGVARRSVSRTALQTLPSLNEAARLHAMDMAARNYASHTDKEGRSHLDRVRQLDRQSLFGAFGANVTIVPAGTSAKDIMYILMEDSANTNNLLRRDFNRSGMGAVQAGGRLYIVQIFAERAGALEAPAPFVFDKNMSVAAKLNASATETPRWAIESTGGKVLASSRSGKFEAAGKAPVSGMLTATVKRNGATGTLKGPALIG